MRRRLVYHCSSTRTQKRPHTSHGLQQHLLRLNLHSTDSPSTSLILNTSQAAKHHHSSVDSRAGYTLQWLIRTDRPQTISIICEPVNGHWSVVLVSGQAVPRICNWIGRNPLASAQGVQTCSAGRDGAQSATSRPTPRPMCC